MDKRDVSLSLRVEATRDKATIEQVTEFELVEIKCHFDESFAVINNLFETADRLIREGNVDAGKNVWRSQIVFSSSILDFFIHELSKYAIVAMFSGKWPKSQKYKNFMLPMRSVEKGINSPENTSWLAEIINERISREVYLAYETMKEQVNLLGFNFGELLKNTFPTTDGEGNSLPSGKQIIESLYSRRNQICHQMDRLHTTAEQNDITKEFTEEYLKHVETIVSMLYRAAVSCENQ